MSPEEIRHEREQRRRAARYRFRRLGRVVAANRNWLCEVEGQLGGNVRQNVALIVKRKGVKGILGLREKALMNLGWEHRTREQKHHSVMLMCKLRCLAAYSVKVRARLAKVVRYMYVQQGRTVLRETHPASSAYFILDGEVNVSRKQFNPIDKVWEDVTISVLGAGDMFGEVALLLDSLRTTTAVTAVDTELLAVDKAEFNEILAQPLNAKWNKIFKALDRFNYFTAWTISQRQDCCSLARIQQFEPLQTIYAEDTGKLNSVFFVLSGSCTILQLLKMHYNPGEGINKYELQEIEQDVRTKSLALMKRINKAAHLKRKSIAYNLESFADIEDDEDEDEDDDGPTGGGRIGGSAGASGSESAEQAERPVERQSVDSNVLQDVQLPGCYAWVKEMNEAREREPENQSVLGERTSSKKSLLIKEDVPKRKEALEFVEVGTFTCGSVFGLGEEMLHRTIVAKNTVQCLLIPRYWLMEKQQNVGNVWQRMTMWLNMSVPSRRKIFNDFVATNNWRRYRRQVVAEVMRRTPVGSSNTTTIMDVPLKCRIDEGI